MKVWNNYNLVMRGYGWLAFSVVGCVTHCSMSYDDFSDLCPAQDFLGGYE